MRILLVEDEPKVSGFVARGLEAERYAVDICADGREGLEMADAYSYDLIILDLGLPDMPGLAVCEEIRRWSRVPLLVLSARHAEREKVGLLNAGADDFITKPFGLDELAARVRAHLRRSQTERSAWTEQVVTVGTLVIDLGARTVSRNGSAIKLTPIQWDLLRTFVANRGRTMTHQQLFDAVWRRGYGDARLYLRVHITNLRRKIELSPATPELIITESGVGYRFVGDTAS